MERARRLQIRQLGPELTCHLCHGYFVDAFTVVECLHSFCKSCIMDHVKKSCDCPKCGTQLNKARLTSALRPDQTLQSVVYKLVPRLFNEEMQRRRDFYQDHPQRDRSLSPERRGDVSSQQFVYTLTDPISFSLEFARGGTGDGKRTDLPAVRYFQAPAGLGISQLKKLLRLKHGLGPRDAKVDILYAGDVLSDELIIMDVAYMYNWDRAAPMRFSYRYTTKRPLGAEPPEPAASPSKRRCPAPADDRLSGTDSDKENVENDARPEPLDGVTPVAVTATAAAAAASAAPKPPAERQPPVGARLEGPREPMTSSVTSPRARPGSAAAGAPTEPRPAACAGGEADGQRPAAAAAGAVTSDTPSGTRTHVASGPAGATAVSAKDSVQNGHADKAAAESVKKDVCPNREEVGGVTSQGIRGSDAEKAVDAARPAAASGGDKLSCSASAKDAPMVSTVKQRDRQGTDTSQPTSASQNGSQPVKAMADVPKSPAAPNGVHVDPKRHNGAPVDSRVTHAVAKNSNVPSSGVAPALKHNLSSKPATPQKTQLPSKVAGDEAKGISAQPQNAPKLAAPPNGASLKTSQTRAVASPSTATNAGTHKPMTAVNGSSPKPALQTAKVAKPSAPSKPPVSTPSSSARSGVSLSAGSPASCTSPAPTRPGGGGGGGSSERTPPADDRQCEDSGVDTDSSERPGADTARSPIDVYDFDAEAEDETAVRLKTTPSPVVVPENRTPSRPMAVAKSVSWLTTPNVRAVDSRVTSPGVRMTHPPQRPGHPTANGGPPSRPAPSSTLAIPRAPSNPPAGAMPQRPVPSSTPVAPPQRPVHPSATAVPPQRPVPHGATAVPVQRPAPPGTPGVSAPHRPPPGPAPAPAQRPAAPAGGQPSAVPPSPRRSLASLPALRPIGAGAIPLMTGQLDQFLWLVSQSAVSHPNGSWRLPADASALLSRATAPSQPASGKPIRPKPTQRKPSGQMKHSAQGNSTVSTASAAQPKSGHQVPSSAASPAAQRTMPQQYRLSSTQGIQNLVTNEITITKIPNMSRSGTSSSASGRPSPSPAPAEPPRSPAGRATADGSVTIEKIRAAPASQPQPARPPNSPKLLAIAESLAMKQIQAAAGKTPPPVSTAPPPSAIGSLLSLSQSQQLGVSRQPSAGDQSAARCRPVSGSAARRQIPNPALLHQQSQGRLTVLNVPPAEAAGTGSGSGSSTSSGSLARMERLTNSLGR
ncbi:nascent polypeptide-associated complex subunit alpha, muscle-specific form-like [Amphibalanus amphitrite]|uniref:nascent polypeptide-associated complex subunit alpha, muscle-specific form-like n=1 Tax=Amphibalanus amphitrite TaxID=1232801 RepID=UPI001C90EE57|nr:nascent polypeptide-associated complex subunit alpha, muscle-specific form-like [Amphibalanus amphitrite]XP_043233273.1 nascent polypeptide-associated complex subunit alpha, muscle-specific form-like [Amphibalanus amphitrite]